ncbi:MAG: beta-N-acetylhexosaminidase [Verrucomicrobia bacterium]|nr:beta-N-acetylhexosaminidase [Verrucomicrobiota bacterium]
MFSGIRSFFAALILLSVSVVSAFAACDILPLPQKYTEKKNVFVPAQGLDKRVSVKHVKSLDSVPAHAQNEAYELVVSKGGVKIKCVSDAGEGNARKTLAQMIKRAKSAGVPACKILDWPAYPMRGFMMDCGRSYIPLADLKKIIAFCAEYKINIFHWHLTENQGWRTESRVYPELNDKKNYTRDHGKFYTFKEIRELVDYCDSLGVMLIPEIDMPGHSAAFERTFKCSMQSEKGTEILKKLVDEIIKEGFSSKTVPYFHIGTDEVRITNPDFVPEMVAFVRERGKKVATWNPGAHYKPGEIDLVQMWSGRGRPLAGTPSLDSRLHYFNHFDSFADPVALFYSNFAETPEANDTIAGGIAAIWCDRYILGTDAILANNSFYPSILAFAESAWHGGRDEYFHGTGTVIPLEGEKLKKLKNFERRMLPVKKELGAKMPWVPQANMLWRITEPFPNGGKLDTAFPPEKGLKNEYEFDGKTIGTRDARGAAVYLRHVWGPGKLGTVSAFFKNPQANSTVYAYTYVWSPKAQKVGLWAQTHKISASEPDLPPPQGKWDARESRFWLNDKEILPPKWENSHKNRNQETPLANENFEVREPIPVQLKQGWNKVLIKLPVAGFSSGQARLYKWMFTFALVSPKGDAPVEGLIWSPDKQK